MLHAKNHEARNIQSNTSILCMFLTLAFADSYLYYFFGSGYKSDQTAPDPCVLSPHMLPGTFCLNTRPMIIILHDLAIKVCHSQKLLGSVGRVLAWFQSDHFLVYLFIVLLSKM